MRHYAGDVAYRVQGFVDKNNDLLFRDLKETMTHSSNLIITSVFPKVTTISAKFIYLCCISRICFYFLQLHYPFHKQLAISQSTSVCSFLVHFSLILHFYTSYLKGRDILFLPCFSIFFVTNAFSIKCHAFIFLAL